MIRGTFGNADTDMGFLAAVLDDILMRLLAAPPASGGDVLPNPFSVLL